MKDCSVKIVSHFDGKETSVFKTQGKCEWAEEVVAYYNQDGCAVTLRIGKDDITMIKRGDYSITMVFSKEKSFATMRVLGRSGDMELVTNKLKINRADYKNSILVSLGYTLEGENTSLKIILEEK